VRKYLCLLFLIFNSLPLVHARTYTLEDLLGKTRSENFSVQEKAQSYLRAYHHIKVSIGMLMPHLNFNIVIKAIEPNYFDYVPSLLGFLFPSNWFRWKESKILYQAERLSYAALIANELNAMVSTYYRIHFLLCLEGIYKEYLKDFLSINTLAEIRFAAGEESAPDFLEIKNVISRLKNDLINIQASLRSTQYELAKTVNLNNGRWDRVRFAKIPLPDLAAIVPISAAAINDQALVKSYEMQGFDYLIYAAKYAILKRSFSFMSPNSDPADSLGFGYGSVISIARSQRAELLIKQREQAANITFAVHEASNNYNANIALFKGNRQGLENTLLLKKALLLELQSGEPLVLSRFTGLLNELLAFHTQVLQAQHKYLIAKNQLDRLLLRAPFYENIYEGVLMPIKGVLIPTI
jgi:hypothetical protein